MYHKDDTNQLKFKDFYLPFGGQLRSDNRWVVLSKHIPWDKIEQAYNGQTRRHLGSCDHGCVYGNESGENTHRPSYFFTVCRAGSPGKPTKVPHIRMQLAFDAEDQHQNITDNNNEVLSVAYSASPK